MKSTLTNADIASYHEKVRYIIAKKEASSKVSSLLFTETYAIILQLVNTLANSERRYFANFSSKSSFVIQELNLKPEIRKKSDLLYAFYISIRTSNSDTYITRDDLDFAILLVLDFLTSISEEAIPEDILESINQNAKLSSFSRANLKQANEIKEISLRVVEKLKTENKSDDFICVTPSGEELTVRFYEMWQQQSQYLWKNANIVIFNAFYQVGESKYLTVNKHSILVIEPDFMIDATDIAECFQNKGYNINIHFIKRFSITSISQALVAGSIINSVFDELITNEESEFNLIFDQAIKTRLLSCFTMAINDKNAIANMRNKAALHYENIQRVLSVLKDGILSIEPSFISPKYGIKGRLDLMQEYEDSNKKNIIELKSSKPPSLNYFYKNENNSVKTGLWSNNLAQTTCYNLLLDSAYENRSGNSLIYYSAAMENSMRNAPIIEQNKRDVIAVRNIITAIERSIAMEDYYIFDYLTPDKIGSIASYMESSVQAIYAAINTLSDLEKEYYLANLSFLYRELFAQNIGAFSNNPERASNSAWNIENTAISSYQLSNLLIDKEKSKFEKCYIYLEIIEEQNSSLRLGDAVVLYPATEKQPLYKNQILKCVIKNISSKHILISLRNKMLNTLFLEQYENWNIINDNSDNNLKKNISSLSNFIFTTEEKRKLLLGQTKPKKKTINFKGYPELIEQQNELLIQALSSEDYYILQGPPGTGKTSYMLKYMVKYLYENTDENLLLMAYTNQAVDELCSAISSISDDIDFIRLGSKESSKHKANMLSEMSVKSELNPLYKRVKSCRIFCATSSYAVNNAEVFDLKHFDTIIIDEAAQIIESQIVGLLPHTDRFILIGDEKQLPAISMQSRTFQEVKSETLMNIGLEAYSDSLFARLKKVCLKNDWDDAHGMLEKQARMHSEIQEFPSLYFYEGRLKILDEIRQNESKALFDANSSDEFEQKIAKARSLFISSKPEYSNKMNIGEADFVAKIVATVIEKYGEDFAKENIGIIAPFRLQCSTIRKKMPDSIRNEILIDTVERFQGSQRKIIIISFAINYLYELKNITSNFIQNDISIDRKLNVAITRASEQLFIIGNPDILKYDESYKLLIEYHEKMGRVVGG